MNLHLIPVFGINASAVISMKQIFRSGKTDIFHISQDALNHLLNRKPAENIEISLENSCHVVCLQIKNKGKGFIKNVSATCKNSTV